MDDPIAQVCTRHRTRDLGVFSLTLALVVSKEENAIFFDRPSDRCTKGVANEQAGPVRQPLFRLLMQVEPVVGHEGRAMILVYRSMERIGAALGDKCNLRPRGASRIGVGVAGDDPKLLERD